VKPGQALYLAPAARVRVWWTGRDGPMVPQADVRRTVPLRWRREPGRRCRVLFVEPWHAPDRLAWRLCYRFAYPSQRQRLAVRRRGRLGGLL